MGIFLLKTTLESNGDFKDLIMITKRMNPCKTTGIILLLIAQFPVITYSRSAYEYADCYPLRLIVYNGDLYDPQLSPATKYLSLLQWPAKHAGKIIKYNLQSKERAIIANAALPDWAMAFDQNERYLFIAGKGLAVFDKQSNAFCRWKEYDKYEINALACNRDNLFLGTDTGLIWVNLGNNKILKSFTKVDGLNSDRISAVYLGQGVLLVGTYKKTGSDYFGLGLFRLDLVQKKIDTVDLSTRPGVPEQAGGFNMVLDAFPMPNEPDWLRLVFFSTWYAWCCDYNWKTGQFRPSQNQNYFLERTLALNGQDDLSPLAGQMLDYVSNEGLTEWHNGGLPNNVAREVVEIVCLRKEYSRLQSLLEHPDSHTRMAVMGYAQQKEDPKVQEVVLENLARTTDPEVISLASVHLYHHRKFPRNEIEPLIKALRPALLNLIRKNPKVDSDWSAIYSLVHHLSEVEPDIYLECVLQPDEAIQSQLPELAFKQIKESMDILLDENKPLKARQLMAAAILAGYKNDMEKYYYYIDPLQKLASNQSQDATIRTNAQTIVDKYNQFAENYPDHYKIIKSNMEYRRKSINK